MSQELKTYDIVKIDIVEGVVSASINGEFDEALTNRLREARAGREELDPYQLFITTVCGDGPTTVEDWS